MKFPFRIVSRSRYELLKLSPRGARLQARMKELQDFERDHDSILCSASLAALSPASEFSIIDVGANEGEVSRLLATLFPRAVIYAIEADPETFKTLVLKTNGIPNIRPINLAIHSQAGTVDWHHNANSLLSSLVDLTDFRAGTTLMKIKADTLDNFIAVNRISNIALVKIDTEGNDLEVLKGAAQLLKSKPLKYVICEFGIHPNNQSNIHINQLLKLVAESGLYISKLGGFGCGYTDHIYGNVLFEQKP